MHKASHVQLLEPEIDPSTALGALGMLVQTALAHDLPERDPHPNLFEVTLFVLGFLEDATVWPALYVRWELALLEEMGFGLDLTRCAVTGATEGLAFVSPRSSSGSITFSSAVMCGKS